MTERNVRSRSDAGTSPLLNKTHNRPGVEPQQRAKTEASIADDLRAWARGLLPLEAAVGLLIDVGNGALLDGPWVRRDRDGRPWFDADVAAVENGYLSGGERRVLAIATSLVGSDHPVDLGDAVTGLDPDALRLVLAALSYAGGAHGR